MKSLFKKLKHIYRFRSSRWTNNAVIIERRLAHYYHERQVQKIRQLF
ncbi:hypothetical protein ACS127_05500 [Amphibacillus sp. Q70]